MNRNIKTFIYVSVFIHLSGGAALYMYYFNPSAPQPLMEDRVEELEADSKSERIAANQTPPVKKVSMKKPKPVKRKTSPVKTSAPRKKLTTPKLAKKEDPSFQGTGSTGKNSKDSINSTGVEKQPQEETSSTHSKTLIPVRKDKSGKADSLQVSTKAEGEPQTTEEKSPVSSNEEAVASKGEKGKQKSAPPTLQPKALVGKTPQPPEIQKKTEAGNTASSTSLSDAKDNKGDSAAEKTPRENKDQKTSETPSASPQKETLETKEKGEPPVSSNISKPSNASPKFRKFIDLKQKRGNPRLDYPQAAREKKLQGQVSLIYFIDPEGLVDQIQLEKSSGHSLLDNFVLRTMARYEFLPQQKGWVRHTVNFVLKGEEEQTFKLREGKQ